MIMPNITGDERGFSSAGNKGDQEELHRRNHQLVPQQHMFHVAAGITGNGDVSASKTTVKKKRNLPGNPDPTAEVIALSPTTLMARNRFVCEICNKGFQRDQNLQLHRRGHNLPWKLRQRTNPEARKRVYVCPEKTCVHHNPSRALGDLTGIKKHFCRKHGEKKWKCSKCNKKYAVQSDWKAHSKTCGTREYKCDCGIIFSRRDSFITHRAFCDALAQESNIVNQELMASMGSASLQHQITSELQYPIDTSKITIRNNNNNNNNMSINLQLQDVKNPLIISSTSTGLMPLSTTGVFPSVAGGSSLPAWKNTTRPSGTSATALLQKAAQVGAASSSGINCTDYVPYHQSNVDGLGFANAMLGAQGVDVRGTNDMGFFSAQEGTFEGKSGSSTRYGGGDTMTVDFLGRRQ